VEDLKVRRLKQVVVISFLGVAIALFATEFLTLSGQAQQGKTPAPGPAQPAEGASTGKPRDYTANYDHFDNEKVNRTAVDSHKALTDAQRCEVCHSSIQVFVSQALEARPYHDSCVNCHAEQFTSSNMEICASCHPRPIKPEQDGTTKFFKFNENLKQFGMEFSHNTHSRRPNWDCNTCHETPSDGKTARSTFPDHPECYVCHKENNQPAKGGCNECHNKGAKAELFYSKDRSQIDMAYTYFKFNHGIHLVQPRANKCEECHDVNNTDANNAPDISRIKLVLTTNFNLIHKSLCFKCHNPSPDQSKGENCNKCHAKPVGSLALNPPPGYKKP
jgi:hypothetical protein